MEGGGGGGRVTLSKKYQILIKKGGHKVADRLKYLLDARREVASSRPSLTQSTILSQPLKDTFQE